MNLNTAAESLGIALAEKVWRTLCPDDSEVAAIEPASPAEWLELESNAEPGLNRNGNQIFFDIE